MVSNTSNLNLVKQANNENWSNDIHNANLQKIDDAFAHLIDPSAGASDLNNCKTLGFYRSSPSASNNPVSGYFSIFVVPFVGNRDLAQIATEVNTNRTFVRTLHDSTAWTAWKELADVSQSATSIVDFGANQQSGVIKLVRSGKVRQLLFDDAKLPADATHFTFDTSVLPASDRPLSTTTGILRKGNGNELFLIWVRNSGTFGQGGGTAGQLVNGALTWVTG